MKASGRGYVWVGDSPRVAVIPATSGSPPSTEQLEGVTDRPCDHWVLCWCPTRENAELVVRALSALREILDIPGMTDEKRRECEAKEMFWPEEGWHMAAEIARKALGEVEG